MRVASKKISELQKRPQTGVTPKPAKETSELGKRLQIGPRAKKKSSELAKKTSELAKNFLAPPPTRRVGVRCPAYSFSYTAKACRNV